MEAVIELLLKPNILVQQHNRKAESLQQPNPLHQCSNVVLLTCYYHAITTTFSGTRNIFICISPLVDSTYTPQMAHS